MYFHFQDQQQNMLIWGIVTTTENTIATVKKNSNCPLLSRKHAKSEDSCWDRSYFKIISLVKEIL